MGNLIYLDRHCEVVGKIKDYFSIFYILCENKKKIHLIVAEKAFIVFKVASSLANRFLKTSYEGVLKSIADRNLESNQLRGRIVSLN